MNSSNKLFEPALVQTALKQSFIKLDPRVMVRNPVMFTVEVGTVVMAYVPYILSTIQVRVLRYITFLSF